MNYRDLKQKNRTELLGICRNEKSKYRGFSSYSKKDKLIQFIIKCNSSAPLLSPPPRPIIPNLYSFFETPEEYDENQQRMFVVAQQERPEQQQISEIVDDIRKNYPLSTVHFDINEDPHNDIIYKTHKMKYLDKYGSLGEHDEQILFHGTDELNLESILRDDFRLTSNAIHGSLYGRGIYFTNNIEKAINYSERGLSTKYIVTAIVHVGDIIKGTHDLQNHPLMPDRSIDHPKIYDTSVDSISEPIQFIKKHHGTYNIIGVINIMIY